MSIRFNHSLRLSPFSQEITEGRAYANQCHVDMESYEKTALSAFDVILVAESQTLLNNSMLTGKLSPHCLSELPCTFGPSASGEPYFMFSRYISKECVGRARSCKQHCVVHRTNGNRRNAQRHTDHGADGRRTPIVRRDHLPTWPNNRNH